ncbi:MAG TPA: hypothetical protein VGK78_15695 [Nocardioides sp.]|uniref:hypothetical protein n=1 Tax=Nocardioides sp. TaxID=35761 RepID=UPI002F428B09
MTDRLASLMHGEAETLDIPAPPAAEILGAGRRMQHRRTLVRGAAGVAVLAVAATTVGVLTLGGGGNATDTGPAAGSTPDLAYGVGDTVYVGQHATPVRMPEVAQTLYYTSAGVLVRTNKDGSSDGGAPFHFELVGTDGTTSEMGVTLRDVVPSTDPAQPYLAWATMTDGRIRVVVHDVSTDRDVARVDVPGTFSWGGWEAPPVALSGDEVYVGTDDATTVVDWRTGKATTTATIPSSTLPEVEGGRTVVIRGGEQSAATADVVDVATGEDVMDIPITSETQVQLSPDGRFAMTSGYAPTGTSRVMVYDLATSQAVQLPGPAAYGWTTDGSLYQVHGSTLTFCEPTTAACRDLTVPRVSTDALVRYAGFAFES